MGKKRRRFDRAYKVEAVRAALRGDRPQLEVARDLGINKETLYRWVHEFRDDASQSFPGKPARRGRHHLLSQWDRCGDAGADNLVTTRLGGGLRDVLHPSAQVGQYPQLPRGRAHRLLRSPEPDPARLVLIPAQLRRRGRRRLICRPLPLDPRPRTAFPARSHRLDLFREPLLVG